MINFFIKYYSNRFLSKWVVLIFDLFLVGVSFQSSYLIRFGFDYSVVSQFFNLNQLLFVLVTYMSFMMVTGSFRGIIRHSGLQDAIGIIRMGLFSGIALYISHLLIFYFDTESLLSSFKIPFGVNLLTTIIAVVFMLLSRVFIKEVYRLAILKSKHPNSVAIFGAGSAGLIAKNTIEKNSNGSVKVCCFVDDNKNLWNLSIDGVKVLRPEVFFYNIRERLSDTKELIIAVNHLDQTRKEEIVEQAIDLGINVKVVPSPSKWINGELKKSQISGVKIEDLLERPEIKINNHYLIQGIKDKTVLVSGAAGSIGSEIVRQLISKYPKKIILLDNAESPLHNFRIELESRKEHQGFKTEFKFIIGDVRKESNINSIFEIEQPDIVFHAAAYKHVPLMEEFPSEAVLTNIKGTYNLSRAAVKNGVSKFVFVSTDKAVNPTNIMGASKRIAEIYIHSFFKTQDRTKFITTRFGNVLGSNGSVIPLFKEQIENGGPITVTHPEITRFFMTIPEACELVLEAGIMGEGGEIFLFDMGKSVKIVDVAKKMIRLSGLNYPNDIDIVFTGLRPGEKLYEELLADKENTIATYHPKIMMGNNREIPNHTTVMTEIEELISVADENDQFKLVKKMKDLVPEFKSNNSIFENLDKNSGKKIG